MSRPSLSELLADFPQQMSTKLTQNKPFQVETLNPTGVTKYSFRIKRVKAVIDVHVKGAEVIFKDWLPYHERRVKLAYEAEQITEKYLHAFATLLLETLIAPNPVLRHHMIHEYRSDSYLLYETVKELVADNSEHVQAWTKNAVELVGDSTLDHRALVSMKASLLHNIRKGMRQMEEQVIKEMKLENEAELEMAEEAEIEMAEEAEIEMAEEADN